MSKISNMAVVDAKAELAGDVEVGPFSVIGPDVKIGPGCRLMERVTVTGNTIIGRDNLIYPNAVIGAPPQDKKYRGAATKLEVGDGNIIREAVSLHCGTEAGGGITRLGNNNLVMVNFHLGHDAQFGNNNVLGNNVMIAGHVVCGDNVIISGGVGVHHFVSIGDFAFIAGNASVTRDVPPYCRVDVANRIRALNSVGLERAGCAATELDELEECFRRLFTSREKKSWSQRMAEFDTQNGIGSRVKQLIDFLKRRDSGKHGRYLEGLREK